MENRLRKLLNNAYAPYSKYRVACAILMKDGSVFEGVNVENASYGATVCAERNAIFNAISHGYKKGDFDKIYVMTDSDDIGQCCFICRQVILEFFEDDKKIINYNIKGEMVEAKVSDLCPNPFVMKESGD